MSLRNFFRLLRVKPTRHAQPLDSLARTAKEALHVRGGNQQSGGFSGSDAVYKQIGEGHEAYDKSFKKKD